LSNTTAETLTELAQPRFNAFSDAQPTANIINNAASDLAIISNSF
jgi:hypothetical protein